MSRYIKELTVTVASDSSITAYHQGQLLFRWPDEITGRIKLLEMQMQKGFTLIWN